jgi:hypothetical protein
MARTSRPQSATPPAEAPPGQHLNFHAWSDNDLIARNHELDDHLKAAQKQLDEWAKPHKAELTEIKQILFARLNERGADSTRTDAGTAYISTIMSTKIEDLAQLFDFVAENWDTVGGEIGLSIKIDAVRTFMENHNGQLPPGVSVSHYQRININRS